MNEPTGRRCIICAAPQRIDPRRRKLVVVHIKGCPDHLRTEHRTETPMESPVAIPGLVTEIDSPGEWSLFTFGTGSQYAGRCVGWMNEGDPGRARARMVERFARAWAFEYDADRGGFIAVRYGLRLLTPAEIPPCRTDLDPALRGYVDGILGADA